MLFNIGEKVSSFANQSNIVSFFREAWGRVTALAQRIFTSQPAKSPAFEFKDCSGKTVEQYLSEWDTKTKSAVKRAEATMERIKITPPELSSVVWDLGSAAFPNIDIAPSPISRKSPAVWDMSREDLGLDN